MKQEEVKRYLKKYKWIILAAVLILLLSFLLKIYKLTYLPVFGDEAIYIRWSQIMRAEPSLRFIPLSDGKQPLFMWAMMPFLKVFKDPLFAGRFLSLLCGTVTAIGVFVLSCLFSKSPKISILALFIYSFLPFSFFFDRLALVDSMLSMFGIWFIILSLLVVKYLRFDLSIIAGFILGLALLTKSPAIFFALLTPLTLISVSRIKKSSYKLLKTLFLFGCIYFIGYGMYNFLLRLGPNFQMIALRNKDYIFPISHLWSNPKDPFIFHMADVFKWFVIYGTWPVFGFFILGITKLKNNRKDLFILLAFLMVPLLVQSEFAKVFTTRYIYFVLPYYVIISAYGFDFILKRNVFKYFAYFLFLLFLFFSMNFYRKMVTNLNKLPLARTDRSGFLEEWTSGTGIYEAAQIIESDYLVNSDRKIVVGTEGYFGTLPDGLLIYLNDYKEITIIGTGIDIKEIPKSLIESRDFGNKTYFLINSSRLLMDYQNSDLKLLAAYPKALRAINTREYNIYGPQETLYLFEVSGKSI